MYMYLEYFLCVRTGQAYTSVTLLIVLWLYYSQIQNEIKTEVQQRVSEGYRAPNLTVVLVGEDPPSHTYVRNKVKSASKIGMTGNVIRKPDTITEVSSIRNLLRHVIIYHNFIISGKFLLAMKMT